MLTFHSALPTIEMKQEVEGMMLKLIEEYETHVMEESANITAEELNRV